MTDETIPQATTSGLTLEVVRTGDIAVVRCRGRLATGVTDFLTAQVKELIPENKRIVLDLTDLAFIDSMGIGTLVRLYLSAKASGCVLELVNLGKPIRKLFAALNLLSVFTIIGENDIRVP